MTKIFRVGNASSPGEPTEYTMRQLIKFLVAVRIGDRIQLTREQ